MSNLIFCNEGQSEASITIEGIEYKTDKPPLIVSSHYGYRTLVRIIQTIGNNDLFIANHGIDELLTKVLRGVGSNIEDFYIFPDGRSYIGNELNPNRIFVMTLAIPSVYYYYIQDTFTDRISFNCRDSEKLLFQSSYIPEYKINCDGCKPGECKGKQSKYPGYVCLDCKRMKQSINNSILRLK